ncbi:CYTH domain-containing protein [Mucilaginibacter sp. dw_454]|uniref:CYTH domain-containing protein n=1 Tax=Mucilaginibacter sp. dw_454 TaxID=2720079 RepID=UPI001BD3077A|nr:CYTH domain-containing protein [Mucilaginibacter sp. dw_454]
MGIEIERKFLVDHKKWQALNKPAGTKLRQGYIVDDQTRTVRLRIAGDNAWLTFKGGTQGISRTEYEYDIPVGDAAELFEQFVKSGLEKTRYCITYADKLWEVDVFEGDNNGLIVAEIELDSEDEQFELPPWIGEEVSDDPRYYNSSLSVRPFKTW